MLTDEQIEINKDEIISLLRSIKREGVDNVIDYLIKSNFFIYIPLFIGTTIGVVVWQNIV